jgi:biopolymer transport protein ExbD
MTVLRPRRRRRAEPLVALINVVFLLLIFLLVAGTIAAPLSPDLRLVETGDLDPRSPPDAAVVLRDGTLLYRGDPVTVADYVTERTGLGETAIRIVPDRDLPARRLVALTSELRRAGAAEVWIVTERALR